MPTYHQIDRNGNVYTGSEPDGPDSTEIRTLIHTALNTGIYSFEWLGDSRRQPYHGIFKREDLHIDLYIYSWRISNGGREGRPEEKRIQIRSNVNSIGFDRSFSKTEKSLLIGVYQNVEGMPIFASWSIEKNRERGQSKSCFIPVRDLSEALKQGFISGEDRHHNPHYAFRSDYFGQFVEILNEESSTHYSEIINSIEVTEAEKLDLSTGGNKTVSSLKKLLARVEGFNEKEKDAIVKRRIGQGDFKKMLVHKYGGRCCLCGLESSYLLVGSHIKPWSVSEDNEKLDHNNGLLLCALHDALFDSRLISFNTYGQMIISDLIPEQDRELLKLENLPAIEVLPEMEKYLEWHRSRLRS